MARRNAERSAQRERIRPRFSSPGLILATRKIALLVSGVETGCETTAADAVAGALMGSDAIGVLDAEAGRRLPFRNPLKTGHSIQRKCRWENSARGRGWLQNQSGSVEMFRLGGSSIYAFDTLE